MTSANLAVTAEVAVPEGVVRLDRAARWHADTARLADRADEDSVA